MANVMPLHLRLFHIESWQIVVAVALGLLVAGRKHIPELMRGVLQGLSSLGNGPRF